MDYKKKYNDALERAKKYKLKEDLIITQDIFPELKESEDERIRKSIIAILKNYVDDSNTFKPKMIAWLEKQGETYTKKDVDNAYLEGMAFAKDELEKQGEQKPTVITKFKVGDKVRLKGSCGWYNVTEIRGVEYYLTSNDVVPCLLPICEQDDWEVEQKPLPLIDGNYILKATEEYRKDRESCGIKDPIMLNEIEEAYYEGAIRKQKHEWSEKDEKMLNNLMALLVKLSANTRTDSTSPNYSYPEEIDWLKSIKQRIGG